MTVPTKLVAGWTYPETETGLVRNFLDLQLMPPVLAQVREKRVCVQAGGAVGIYAVHLAKQFDVVYTFEPNPILFHCHMQNCKGLNVRRYQAALGCQRGMIHVFDERRPENMGAWRVGEGGDVPTMFIDDLALERCDFILLDIEGAELNALKGGLETIKKYKPVLMIEWKENQFLKFGYARHTVTDWLGDLGYKEPEVINGGRDAVFVCKTNC